MGRWAGRSSAACASATDGAGDIPVNPRAAFRPVCPTLPARLAGTGGRSRVCRILVSGVLAAGLALSACSPDAQAPGGEGKGAHEQGQPTIVSLNPCTDAILAQVADPAQIRALSAYSSDPEQSSMDVALARRFPATNGAVETVLALHPDLLVASTYTDPASLAAMRAVGLHVETFAIANSVAQSRAQVRDLARLAGHVDRGEALVRQIDRAMAEAVPAPGSKPIPAVLWEPGGTVPGQATLVAELMAQAGFANFSAQRGLGQSERLPLERMLADPPRVILAVGDARGPVPEDDRLLFHPALAALGHTARATLAPNLIYCGGPTIPRMLARLVAVRHQLDQHQQDIRP